MRRFRTFEESLIEDLKDPAEAALFLEAAAEYDDPVFLLEALSIVAKAHGMSKMAARVSLSRMGMYKSLSKKGNPGLRTFMGILNASGLRLSFRPANPRGRFS